MIAPQGESSLATLERCRARVVELEAEAIASKGDVAEGLRVHSARYESLVLAIAQVIWTRDPTGAMTRDQPSWVAYTGQTFAQYQGDGWLDAVHPEDRELTVAAWTRAVAVSAPFEVEHRLRRHDGEYHFFSVRAVPVLGADGTIREWTGIHTDITDRKLTEQMLREGERRYRELADSMPQIVWTAGPNGHFDYYNQRWYQYTGRPEGISGDESWTDVVHPDDQKECLERWHSATKSGDAYEIEYRLREKTGVYHWFLRRALPARDPSGRITRWFGTCTNIDKVKKTEEGLLRAKIEADSANRELEAFSYSVAHDLRAPLRSIDGFSQAILEDNAEQLDDEGKSHFARVRAAAQRMAHLIDDLLSLSRVTRVELRREPVNLTRVAQGIAERLREAEAGRDVEFVVEQGLMVEGDNHLLASALENLLGNACKFTSKREKALIEVGRLPRRGEATYFVRDNGAGFDMAHSSKLFGAFHRLHPNAEFPGTGIGLATVQRIVRRHGGSIWAEGKVDHGATFFFTLGGGTEP